MKRFLSVTLLGLCVVSWSAPVQAQLVSAWSAPQVDDGNPVSASNAWLTETASGEFVDLLELGSAQALAADTDLGIVYASSGQSLSSFGVNGSGGLVPVSSGVAIRNSKGVAALSRQVVGMGFANGLLYASVVRSASDARRNRGLEAGFYAIDPETAQATLLRTAAQLPTFSGLDYNTEDGLMYGVVGGNNAQSIVRFSLSNFQLQTVAAVPASAYAGETSRGLETQSLAFDGLAVGDGQVFLTNGLSSAYADVAIVVFDLEAGEFVQNLPTPPRFGENRFYASGATFLPGF